VQAGDGVVRVSRETKGRKGKGVTLITGIPLAGSDLKAYAKQLKARCGTGGTVKEGVVEIQGDQRDILVPLLKEKGWTVKRAGG
jgi:translation initiation factor 1